MISRLIFALSVFVSAQSGQAADWQEIEADAKGLGSSVPAQLPEIAVFNPVAKNPQRATLTHPAWRRNPFPEAFFEHPAGGRSHEQRGL